MPATAVAAVIDVLRATSTLTVARHHGAARLVPVGSPDEALRVRVREPEALLAGERDGKLLSGFDFGNSPFEMTRAAVEGRTLVFASTNGSIALLEAHAARRRLLACLLNLDAVVEKLAAESEVVVVCSGKLGRFSLEDAACAGLLVERLVGRGAVAEGREAALALRLAPRDGTEARALVQGSSHGRYLRALGPEFARDVDYCGGLSVLDTVWELPPES